MRHTGIARFFREKENVIVIADLAGYTYCREEDMAEALQRALCLPEEPPPTHEAGAARTS